MKNYEKIVELGCFSLTKLANELSCCKATATSLIQKYLKNGYIERIRRDMYVAISIETKQPILSRYEIGSRLFDDAYLSHHTAFEVYGYANQIFYTVNVATNTRFTDFIYDGVLYHRTAPKNFSVNTINNIKLSSLEQTVIDSINDIEKIAGIEETLRCILLIPSLNADKLLNALKAYDNGFLYQKCGYIFEQLNNVFRLPESFFAECLRNTSKAKRYLTKDHINYVWNEKWKLYAPENIYTITDKGVADYD